MEAATTSRSVRGSAPRSEWRLRWGSAGPVMPVREQEREAAQEPERAPGAEEQPVEPSSGWR